MTTPRKTAPKKPADRKPPAAKTEAKLSDVAFEFDGSSYTIGADNVDNMELFELVEDGKMISAIRGFVGPEQWERFKDESRTPDGRVPMAATERFLQAVMDAVGNLEAS